MELMHHENCHPDSQPRRRRETLTCHGDDTGKVPAFAPPKTNGREAGGLVTQETNHERAHSVSSLATEHDDARI